MRAIQYERNGEPGTVLGIAEIPEPPAPGPGEVRIRVTTRPIHPGDLVGVRGRLSGPPDRRFEPVTPGLEGTGIVDVDSSGFVAGQRVAFFMVPGAYAEVINAPADLVIAVPYGMDERIAANMLINNVTARMIVEAFAAGVSPAVLAQTAAGSAVARLVSEHAQRLGWQVIDIVRSTSGAEALRTKGARKVVSTSDDDWKNRVRAAAGDQPIQAIVDPVGGPQVNDLLDLVEDGGILVATGGLDPTPAPINWLHLTGRAMRLQGVTIGNWAATRTPDERRRDMEETVKLAAAKPGLFEADHSFDLANFAQAIRRSESPGRTGTVLLTSHFPRSATAM